MKPVDLSVYTDDELESLSRQVHTEIVSRAYTANQKFLDRVCSPAFNELKAFYRRWAGFSRLGKPDYYDFSRYVYDWTKHIGVDVDAEGGVSKIVSKLDTSYSYYEFDEFVDPSE